MYHSFIKEDHGCQSCALRVNETMIHDINDLQRRLMQTSFDFEQDITDAAIDQWRDRV